jgi:hypothetical protein
VPPLENAELESWNDMAPPLAWPLSVAAHRSAQANTTRSAIIATV